MAEWAELGLHPACSLGRCVVRLFAHSLVSHYAPCSTLKNVHEYSYPVAPLRRSTAGFGPVRGVHMGACAFVACAGSVMTALRCNTLVTLFLFVEQQSKYFLRYSYEKNFLLLLPVRLEQLTVL